MPSRYSSHHANNIEKGIEHGIKLTPTENNTCKVIILINGCKDINK